MNRRDASAAFDRSVAAGATGAAMIWADYSRFLRMISLARLSWVGWLFIVVSIAAPLHERWRSALILGSAGLSGAAIGPAGGEGNGLWFMGVLLLVLASAWRYGAELREERDLTV